MSRIVGIDFGTTKTVAAVMEGKYPRVIPDRKGRLSIPSVVLVSDEQEFFVGWEAKEHHGRYKNEYISINSIKRALGGRNDKTWGWLKHHPQAVAALILGRLKIELEHYFQDEVNRAVIAIPAHFDLNQRWAVKQAAETAGFQVLKMLNEATAAALSFTVKRRPDDQTVLVLDFGGGTLDASVLEVGKGVCEVIATTGDGLLGGDDFDKLIADHILEMVRGQVRGFENWTPLQNAVVSEAAVTAKIELSAAQSCHIHLPGLVETPSKSYHNVDIVIDRKHFELLSEELLARTEAVLNQVVKDAGQKIDEVLLIGGTSRIPAVRELVSKIVGRRPVTAVDPLTCVAEGASVIAGIWSGNTTDFLLLDTYPNSLSISTQGGTVKRLIERNTTIPTRKSEIFSTNKDNQTWVNVAVYEGERPMAADNFLMGSVTLSGIPPAPRGMPQIEVTFDIDGNGILNVSAKDMATKRKATATMVAPSRLTNEQLEVIRGVVSMEMKKIRNRLAREAGKAEEEEKKRKAFACIEKIQGLLDEYGAYITEERVTTLRAGCNLVRDYLDRQVPASDLYALLSALGKEIDKSLANNIAHNVRKIFEDLRLAPWAESAAVSLDDQQSTLESMKDFRMTYGSLIDSIKADLNRASSEADVYSGALRELQESVGERYCLGLVISYFAGHIQLDLNELVPSSVGESKAEPLLMLLLVSEMARDKPRRRRTAAVGPFTKLCRLEHLIAIVGQMAHEDDEVGEKLLERLRKVSSEDFYKYFRSIEPERRFAHFSDRHSRARLRDALLEVLHGKSMEEKKFILVSLSGIVDDSCTPALLAALTASDEDDDVRTLIINLLSARQDPRVIDPLLKLIASSGPSVRDAALTALDNCRNLMNEEWFSRLSSQEWYEYYSTAPASLRNDWLSKAGVRLTLRTALCEVLPERTVGEQMSILDVLAAMADSESVPEYINLLPRLGEPQPCCRLISMLAPLRDSRVFEPLVILLSDERPEVRETAAEALASCKELIDPDTTRFIKITREVMDRGWPPSLSDRFFFSRYMKRHGEFVDVANKLKRQQRA